jgi:hypothetical protein
MQILTVVNNMIGLLGETPLASIEEPHQFKGAGLSLLDQENRATQARGWWFNVETTTLSPMLNGRISLAGDVINVRTESRLIVQRGRYLYDLDNGTDIFESPVDVSLIRLVPFEQMPESAAAYVAACATKRFQLLYDGDSLKSRELSDDKATTSAYLQAENTRNGKANLIHSNASLMRLKYITRQARRLIRV